MVDDKLRKRMSASKSGWGWRDLHRIYISYGFKKREGSNHTVYSHPAFPQLRATVARHRSLPKGYTITALRLISELEQLENVKESTRNGDEEH